MLAYSSIEHTGLACVGLALGPIGAFAALLHLVNHSLVKSAMFLLSGRVSHRYGTTEIGGVSGLLRAMPVTGSLFTIGILAVVGLPPFGLFVSELWLLRAGFATGHYVLAALVLGLLVIVFVAVVPLLNQMAYGTAPAGIETGEHERLALLPIAAALAAVVALGLFIPAALGNLLTMGAQIVVR
jgi:hydrogenase-4 component F